MKPPMPFSSPSSKAGDAAAGDPGLVAGEDPVVAAAGGAGGHVGRRRAGVGLGDEDGGFVAGEDEFGGQFFLGGGAVGHDGADGAHVGFDGDAAADGAGLGEFLDDQHGVEVGEAGAAPFLGDGEAGEAGFGHAGDHGPGVLFGFVGGGGLGGGVLGEFAGAGAEAGFGV